MNVQEPALQNYGAVLAWYRPKLLRRLVGIWAIAAGLVALGALAAGLTFWTREIFSPGIRTFVAIVGGLATFVGPLYAMVKMPRLLGEERYLAMFRQGVLFRVDERFEFIAWDDLTAVQWEQDSNALSLCRGQEPPMRVSMAFTGIDNKELATEINRMRIKAQMGLRLS